MQRIQIHAPGPSAHASAPPALASRDRPRSAFSSPATDVFEQSHLPPDFTSVAIRQSTRPALPMLPVMRQAGMAAKPAAVGYDGSVIQRQIHPHQTDPMDDPRMHPPGAPKAAKCAPPSWCPKSFCEPYSSESFARHQRTKMMPILMAGIAAAVDSRVVPLWHEHLLGGSSMKNLTATFGPDFTGSRTTRNTTALLVRELKRSLTGAPPAFPAGKDTAQEDIGARIGSVIAQLGDPGSPNQMNFNVPAEVPGNLAGGIGTDQSSCAAGARPSSVNDERSVSGNMTIVRDPTGSLTVTPAITYTVKDTIDLCPGDCGNSLEQLATVPISQFEATGISGDVPFSVTFPAPASPFTIPAPVPAGKGIGAGKAGTAAGKLGGPKAAPASSPKEKKP
jgi:hypothetical protein